MAREFLSVDDCMAGRRRFGFARACIGLDLSWPLRPRVMIKRLMVPFWQRFIYENLNGVCLCYGFFHLLEDGCPIREGGDSGVGLSPKSINQAGKEKGMSNGGPRLGPCLVSIR